MMMAIEAFMCIINEIMNIIRLKYSSIHFMIAN